MSKFNTQNCKTWNETNKPDRMAILQQHGFGVQFGVLWEGLELSLA
jgi:hypothetical protein